jgi:hypothetical protein
VLDYFSNLKEKYKQKKKILKTAIFDLSFQTQHLSFSPLNHRFLCSFSYDLGIVRRLGILFSVSTLVSIDVGVPFFWRF